MLAKAISIDMFFSLTVKKINMRYRTKQKIKKAAWEMPLKNKDFPLKNNMNHEVVALPTETVYGLAGMVNS